MAGNNVHTLVTNLKYWIFAIGGLVVGLVLLYVSGLSWFEEHDSFGALANQLGGLLIASIALATLWDLVGRRAFFREMLEVLELKHDVHTSGLESIGTEYRKVIDWDDRLRNAKHLDIFAAWATTWRINNQNNLQRIATRNGAKLRVFLPDPNDNACVKSLAGRFNYTQPHVKEKLNEAIDAYKKFDDNGSRSGRVEIYTTTAYRAFTSYRIDNQFVVTMYHHKDNRRGSFPAFTCREGGSLFAFFEEDLEGVLNASTKIYP